MNPTLAGVFDDYYLNDSRIIKKFGCNRIISNLNGKYDVKYLKKVDFVKNKNLKIQLVQVRLK